MKNFPIDKIYREVFQQEVIETFSKSLSSLSGGAFIPCTGRKDGVHRSRSVFAKCPSTPGAARRGRCALHSAHIVPMSFGRAKSFNYFFKIKTFVT
jgi:hypothetical protein